MTEEQKKIISELVEALNDASEHLEYCGYGDEWERECAYEEKLPDKIEKALKAGMKFLTEEGVARIEQFSIEQAMRRTGHDPSDPQN